MLRRKNLILMHGSFLRSMDLDFQTFHAVLIFGGMKKDTFLLSGITCFLIKTENAVIGWHFAFNIYCIYSYVSSAFICY